MPRADGLPGALLALWWLCCCLSDCAVASETSDAGTAACSAAACAALADDGDSVPGVALLQRPPGVWHGAAVPAAAVETALQNRSGTFYRKVAPCLASAQAQGTVPLSIPMRADLAALVQLGLLDLAALQPCQQQSLAGGLSLLGATAGPLTRTDVELKKQTAQVLVMAWGVLVVSAILWSLASVLEVPQKRACEEIGKPTCRNLANEDAAYQRGFFEWLSLSWVDDLVGRYGKGLSASVDAAEFVKDGETLEYAPYKDFKKHWQAQVDARGIDGASLATALYKTVGFKACAAMVLAVILEMGLQMLGMVVALDRLLEYLERESFQRKLYPNRPVSLFEPSIMIITLIWVVPMLFRLAGIAVTLLDGHYTNICAAGLASAVFEKALSLPAGAVAAEAGEGDVNGDGIASRPNIIQILNVDIIEVWTYFLRSVAYTVVAPLMALGLFVLLWWQVRWAGFFGLLYVLPCLVLSMLGMASNVSSWKRYQGFQDARLQHLTETLVHIRTLKSLAWERMMHTRLLDTRESELGCNQRCTVLRGLLGGIMHTMPFGTMICAMAFLALTQGSVKAAQILVIQRIMASLLGTIMVFTSGLGKMATVPNSFRRIKDFLAQPERPRLVVRSPASDPAAPTVRLRGSFSFVQGRPPVLRDLNLVFSRGESVAVVGAVASGKSALLLAILGDLYPVGGASIEAPSPESGEVAYCAQEPWICEGTLRENVTLKQQPFDSERYLRSLQAAALANDLPTFPGGDQVSVGSHGIRLSRGQRARVALARAAYAHNSLVALIDDPFAAVDVPTASRIFTELIQGPCLHGRTKIVTMQPTPSRLQKFDRVVLMEDGRVAANGPPAEVMGCPSFQSLLASFDPTQRGQEGADLGCNPEVDLQGCGCQEEDDDIGCLREIETADPVSWSAMWWWLKAASLANLVVFAVMLGLQRVGGLFEALAVAGWINAKMIGKTNDFEHIGQLAIVVWACCAVITLAAYAGSRVSTEASRRIHTSVVQALLKAPVDSFFDRHPVGRLVNRLSFDLRQVDDAVGPVVVAILSFFLGMCVTQIFIFQSLRWGIIIMSIPFFLVMALFMYLYRGTAVPLVFHSKFCLSQLQELQAVATTSCVSIRASGMSDDFIKRFNGLSANIIRCNYLVYHACKAWVQSRVFLVYGTLSCIFTLGCLWCDVPMGTLAAIIALGFAQMVEFEQVATAFTHLLNILNALHRLTKYIDIPQEAAAEMPNDPQVRIRVKIDREDLVAFELQRLDLLELAVAHTSGQGGAQGGGSGGCHRRVAVGIRGKGLLVLEASPDGLALELPLGRRLRDFAPSSEALRPLGDERYHVVGVNAVTFDAEAMAQELASARGRLLELDLWQSRYAGGMRLKLEELTAGYGLGRNVLNGMSIAVEPRGKVGLVGTTGCGKTTTLLCILRIIEARGGRVLLGDLDASRLGLQALRSIVGLVPQDPTIFEGTWRRNIDPFGEIPDTTILEALRAVQLLPVVRALSQGLDAPLAKDGATLSYGQRQLLSLARMVVRQPPVLLLDECTSALDPATEEAAQCTLKTAFPMSTLFASAHRVDTIMDFDSIVVLDGGAVAETGTVEELLRLPDGIFAKMIAAASKR